MKRLIVMLRIVLFLVLGVALLYSPWIPLWTKNFFFAHYAWVSPVARNNYVRGAISGLGLVDIGLAFAEARRMKRPPVRPK